MIIYYTLSGSGRREESRALLQDAIAEYIGDAEKAGAMLRGLKTGEKGKPYIDGLVPFSVSHSGRAWAVLFCDEQCGLDIQYEMKRDIFPIAERWYDPLDAERVRSAAEAGEEEGAHEFFRLWTRREALVKALGNTVLDAALPSVSGDKVNIGDTSFVIDDIILPGATGLHAAVCIKGSEKEALSSLRIIKL